MHSASDGWLVRPAYIVNYKKVFSVVNYNFITNLLQFYYNFVTINEIFGSLYILYLHINLIISLNAFD